MDRVDLYELKGITRKQAEAWEGKLREDLTVIKRMDGTISSSIDLKPVDAFVMRIKILIGNVRNHYGFRLVRVR